MLRTLVPLTLLALAACAPRAASGPIEVGLIAINDFHGNLEPPKLTVGTAPAGGAAHLASAIRQLRSRHRHSLTVAAGDLTGASPLASSIFLDEPSVAALNLMGLDLTAAGNHEFDRGTVELKRLQDGGCGKNTLRTPCALEPFAGAKYRYLAGNTIMPGGGSLFPGTALRRAGPVTIGFIGLTTRTTGTLVSPGGIRGVTFADEAETANRLVPGLKAAGADTIVLLVHEGGYPRPDDDPNACEGFSGAIRDIAARLDPAIAVVVSGHTHKAYVCDGPRAGAGSAPILLTSAGRYGTLVSDISLSFDPATRRLSGRTARNFVVQGAGFTGVDGRTVAIDPALPTFAADPAVAALTARYVAAAAPLADRIVGRISEPLVKEMAEGQYESKLLNLVADAQLAATQPLGAQVAFMNPAGVRTDLRPRADGSITYGDLYAVQPFGNVLMVREYTGAQLIGILEQQFARASGRTMILGVAGMTYAFDRRAPAGRRIRDAKVAGVLLDPAKTYRVSLSNFLAFGGDEFPAFMAGRDVGDGPVDLDGLEAYVRARSPLTPPAADRIREVR